MLSIRQVTEKDIPTVEYIYDEVVTWLDANGKHWWPKDFGKWEVISAPFKMEDFYVAYIDDKPAGCMVLIDYDPNLWPDAPKGEAVYIHRFATTRLGSGGVASTAMIDFAKEFARKINAQFVRLDCNRLNLKLCAIYERNGFVRVSEVDRDKYHAAFYQCPV